ncbi:MAG: DUF5686 family protein [Dysgonamonadaceae bacterium]|jgi:hypothetical protein|nr:DUF5686 family protein [Dysgonamonadaceae bacterium]
MQTEKRHINSVSRKAIFFAGFFSFFFFHSLFSQNEANKADSIISQVLKHRELYGNYIQSYEAKAYIKGISTIKKKNVLLRYAPHFLYLDRKGKNNFTEAFVHIHFHAPNLFTHQIEAINGNSLNVRDIQNRVMQFLNVNIYNPTLFNEQILLPGINDIYKYYRFEYIAATDTLGHRIHQIEIIPLMNSQKLISGYLHVIDNRWTIFSFDISGRLELTDFRIQTEFGIPDNDFLLPQKTEVTFETNLLGNKVVNHYFSSFRYTSVSKRTGNDRQLSGYDLSDYFSIGNDTLPIVRDSTFWNERRPVPLSEDEAALQNSVVQTKTSFFDKSWNFYRELATPLHFNYRNTQFNYSGFLNPLKLSYSKNNGFTYRQKLRLIKQYGNGEELQFNPDAGYLFRTKEIYFSAPLQWIFQPRKFGEVYFNFGNRNQAYNSTIIEEIKQMVRDSINFEYLNKLNYYHHFYLETKLKYEIINGLSIHGGINWDWYIPVKSGGKVPSPFRSTENKDVEEKIELVSETYKAFSPEIKISWTPEQYYRINGKKKEYIGSRYPTFSLDYARGIRGIGGSDSNYERIESDVQQKISFGLMNSFQYYAGMGFFTNAKSIYFADFKNFHNHNFPQSWGDPIGGVFHLLDGRWYNSSDFYAQAHFMYESPLILLKLFKGNIQDIFTERFYFSQLYTPILPSYTEIGFGTGNFIINAGIFVSLNRGKFQSFGTKITFELGI